MGAGGGLGLYGHRPWPEAQGDCSGLLRSCFAQAKAMAGDRSSDFWKLPPTTLTSASSAEQSYGLRNHAAPARLTENQGWGARAWPSAAQASAGLVPALGTALSAGLPAGGKGLLGLQGTGLSGCARGRFSLLCWAWSGKVVASCPFLGVLTQEQEGGTGGRMQAGDPAGDPGPWAPWC